MVNFDHYTNGSGTSGSVMSKTVNLDQVCLELAIYSTSSSSSPFSSSGSHKENKEKKENREKSGPGNSRSFLAGVKLSAGTGSLQFWTTLTETHRVKHYVQRQVQHSTPIGLNQGRIDDFLEGGFSKKNSKILSTFFLDRPI